MFSAVAASSQTDSAALFSNLGTCVDIYAPGQNVTSASSTDDVSAVAVSGTTIAAPLVAGAFLLNVW